MAFKILEQFCEGKGKPEACEDRLVITPHFVAVIDGATSSAPLASGKAGGIVAAEAIARVVQGLPADCDVANFVKLATQAVYDDTGHWPDESKNRPCAAVVVYSAARQEVWRICDGHFMLDGKAYLGDKLIDIISYTYRSTMIRGRLKLGLSTLEEELELARSTKPIKTYTDLQAAYENDLQDRLGYGVINGLPVPEKFIEVHSTQGVSEIVLCSDGFFAPAPTLAAGLAELARLKTEDPLLCLQVNGSRPFPTEGRFFDDTTYVRLQQN
jgi:hypothetical protein